MHRRLLGASRSVRVDAAMLRRVLTAHPEQATDALCAVIRTTEVSRTIGVLWRESGSQIVTRFASSIDERWIVHCDRLGRREPRGNSRQAIVFQLVCVQSFLSCFRGGSYQPDLPTVQCFQTRRSRRPTSSCLASTWRGLR